MNNRSFEKPIETIIGLGFVRPINTIEEAYTFLMDWRGVPGGDRKHALALKAVKAALRGEIEAETVRPFVEAFADAAGVLVPGMDRVIARSNAGRQPGKTEFLPGIGR